MTEQNDNPPQETLQGPEGADLPAGADAPEQGLSDLGVARYVHAAFFALALFAAFVCGKVLLSAWNALADWPAAVQAVPQLIEYSEEQRANWTLIVGAVLGVFAVLRYYRRPSVRSWSTEVAGELSRVTWPNRDMVTNGTLVVVIASLIATVYVALLDRFWGYLTNLVYGA